jgi:hypothetical protein
MDQRTYHYTVNELLIDGCKEKTVTSRRYVANSKPIIYAKNEVNRYFAERRKLVEYWIAIGIYEIDDNQTFELNIKLIETTNGIDKEKEYLTRSITKPIPQSNLDFETNVISGSDDIPTASISYSVNDGESKKPVNIATEEISDTEKVLPDYYFILGISSDATLDEINTAYKIRQNINGTKMWHPDWNPGKDTYKKMRLIHEAPRVLSNKELRTSYNKEYVKLNLEVEEYRASEVRFKSIPETMEDSTIYSLEQEDSELNKLKRMNPPHDHSERSLTEKELLTLNNRLSKFINWLRKLFN